MTIKWNRKTSWVCLFSAFIIVFYIHPEAKPGSAAPAAYKDQRMEKIIRQLDPALRRKAEQAALAFGRAFFSSANNPAIQPLAARFVNSHFPSFNKKQKEVLTAIILYLALQYLDQDIGEIQKGLRNQARIRKKLQRKMEMVQNKYPELKQNANRSTPPPLKIHPSQLAIQAQTSRLKIQYSTPSTNGSSDLVGSAGSGYDLEGGAVTIQGLKSLLDDLKGQLDGMNEMAEQTSLRLQMTMDRRSKFISTLSQMMKHISTSQDMLTQNKK